jgi:hypothetical protein
MSEEKYTRGAWQVLPEECDRPYIRIRGTCLGGRFKIANVLTPVYDNVHAREAEETRANAKLIAAAPDLLVALRAMLLLVRRNAPELSGKILGDADAAITKATGAQQ